MFMIDRFLLDTGVYMPVEIFTAPDNMRLVDLLRQLQLEKGEGGSPLQLATPQVRSGRENFPSSLLLQRDTEDRLVVVGALGHRFASCKDFALMISETELIERAREFAAHLMSYNPDNPEDYQRYSTIAVARE